jgi:F0F1-type ATP synthase assembly protein I
MDGRLIALRLLGLGWYVAICIVVGAVGGIWLDRLSGLTPLFTLLGVLIGTVAAFYGLYKMVLPLFNNNSTPGSSGSDGEQSS